jgi:hypothetical protein
VSLSNGFTLVRDIDYKSVSRREVGKSAWKDQLMTLIDSERDDLDALAILRRKLKEDKEAMLILAEMSDRKSRRILEMTILLRYSDKKSANGDRDLYP